MKINIKIKYLILGLGIGIVVTSTLYSIFPEVKYLNLSNETIIEKAKELGMVNLKESIRVDSVKEEVEELLVEPIAAENIEEEIQIEIIKGDNLSDIAKKLFDLEIIDNLDEFVLLARDKYLERRFNYGFYKFKPNTSYSTIIKTMTIQD